MNAQSVALEAATIRQQCKVLRMPTIAAQWKQAQRESRHSRSRFLHAPTVALKEAAERGRGYALLEALKELFGLEGRDAS